MSLLDKMKRWLGSSSPQPPTRPSTPLPRFEEEPEPVVPEIKVEELVAALAEANPPLVLDIRELYEWRQVRLPDAQHIPMNDVPERLAELAQAHSIVVVCAHGSQSYSVAAWLMEQGYAASSLAGGITHWAQQGQAVEQGAPSETH